MTPENPKNRSFPTPTIAKSVSKPESLNLNEVDLSRDGTQGDVVVSKGRSRTFVSKRSTAGDDK
ncbi:MULTISPECIES: hypothetical protein [unclassified Rhizobium]|uniref:hypothetical protein n=1 Tax=unclassified Rhizobium TaxID=2613769 RepID=UPI0012E399A1|nr:MULTISPECIES: hypothetical protein [unclassified Rhizobium]